MKPVIFTLLLFLSFSFFSQNKFSIQGNITSKSKESIAVGDVLLYENNKIITYTSLSEGQFSLTPVIANTYLLKIICVGYEDYEKEILLKENLKLEIILNEKAENLDGISIKATKKVLENKGGNIVANVEGTILAKEMSTIELLSKLPNLQISADGEQVSIIGKGNPLIYVGRQRISLEELQTLQVDDIKTIEIINNPSVKYEAEGRAVLLIIKRRNSKEGTQLNLTEKVSSKTFLNNYLGSNISVKKNNLEWKLNAAYNQLKIWEKNKATYEVTNKNIFSDYEVEAITTRPQYIFGGGLYYSINDTDYISFNSIFRTQNEPFTIDTNTFLEDNGNQQNINTLSNNEGERIFSSSNINYFKAFNAKQNLFLGVQYTNYTRDVDNSIRNTFENATTSDLVTISQDFNVESVVLKGDYSISFEKGNQLEIGFNTARNVSKSLLQINQENSNYKYIEAINALYSQFSGGKENYHYAFGFRLEDTNIEGGFRDSNTLLVDRKNIYIFPRANINFKFSDDRSLNFSFASSINRPNYSTAVTTTAFINPGLEFQGNINLKPTTINEISSSFQVKDKSISLEYFKSKNPVNYRFFFDETRDISIMSPANFNEEIGVNLKVSYPFKYKFWTSTNTATFSYSLINDESILKKEATPYLYFYTNQQFKINNLSSFNLNGWLLSNRKDGIFNRQEVFTINAVFTTKLFSKLDVTVSANDIFNTMEFRENYVLQNLNVSSLFFTDVNEYAISLRYVFGNIKDSNYKNKSVDDELNRMN
tara:strand:+ start:1243 stop:3540 length:2298 start_codon:yes stop_codon:yes gene_type:complete